MGAKSSKTRYESLPIELKLATLNQLQGISDKYQPAEKLKQFCAYGKEYADTLIELKKICEKYGIPDPKSNGGKLCCGTVWFVKYGIFTAEREEMRNPVFAIERNGRYKLSVYYPDF